MVPAIAPWLPFCAVRRQKAGKNNENSRNAFLRLCICMWLAFSICKFVAELGSTRIGVSLASKGVLFGETTDWTLRIRYQQARVSFKQPRTQLSRDLATFSVKMFFYRNTKGPYSQEDEHLQLGTGAGRTCHLYTNARSRIE